MKGSTIFRSRRFKHGSLATAITALFIVAIIIVNVIATLLIERFPLKVDLTTDGKFEVSTVTTDFLKTLEDDIEVLVLAPEETFSSAGTSYIQANQVIKKYEQLSDKIDIKYIDIYKSPEFVSGYTDLNPAYGDVLVKSSLRTKKLTGYDLFNIQTNQQTGASQIISSKAEQAMTGALMYVTDKKPATVTFVTNHSENTLDAFSSLLQGNSYAVSSVNLLSEEIPQETNVLVIAAPTADYDKEELKKLDQYLLNDKQLGKNIVYIAAPQQPALPNLEEFLEEWGISVGSGVLYETDSKKVYGTPTFGLLEYVDADYAKMIPDTKIPVMGANAKPITVLFENNSSISTKVLLKTSDSTVLYPLDADENWDPSKQEKASYPAAVVATQTVYDGTKAKVSNVIAFNSVDMFDNTFLQMGAVSNSDYLVGCFNKVAEKKENINIVPKSLASKQLALSDSQVFTMGIIFVAVVPLLVLIWGLFVWLRRRHL